MKKFSKLLAMILALAMLMSLVACGSQKDTEPDDSAFDVITADDIEDNMTSEDGKYEIAFVTDVGQLKDKSFNQGTYDGVKLYANANGLSYKYYQPANDNEVTDDDRYDAMKAAAEGGAKVVVAAGYMQESALRRAAVDYPDTKFVFIDGYPLDADPDPAVEGEILSNVAGIAFQEEQAGYFAGYAVVRDGFTKLGFSGGGGGTNPACCRFGYGFVQGANAAAAEMDVQVSVNFTWEYGATFTGSPELQAMASGWYETGTEVIFACGGTIFQSISAAASANDGFVVGVDVDQSGESDTVITSAMKGLSDAVQWAVAKAYDGTFDEIGGTGTSLGVKENAVGLPTAEGSWGLVDYTVEEYEAMYDKVLNGELVVDADYSKLEQDYSNLTLKSI